MSTDPISDFLVKIKNAYNAGHVSVTLPHSNVKEAIAKVLEKSGFVGAISKRKKKVQKLLELTLVYEGTLPRINGVERISKPSRRIYRGVADIKPFKNGFGMFVLSTPKGILTDKEAKQAKVGGELLFKIW